MILVTSQGHNYQEFQNPLQQLSENAGLDTFYPDTRRSYVCLPDSSSPSPYSSHFDSRLERSRTEVTLSNINFLWTHLQKYYNHYKLQYNLSCKLSKDHCHVFPNILKYHQSNQLFSVSFATVRLSVLPTVHPAKTELEKSDIGLCKSLVIVAMGYCGCLTMGPLVTLVYCDCVGVEIDVCSHWWLLLLVIINIDYG